MKATELLQKLGVSGTSLNGRDWPVHSPIDGDLIATINTHNAAEADKIMQQSIAAFYAWREIPAPKRGELVRLFGEKLRKHKEDLAHLVTLECGKIRQEGLGEVQEMIDICDFAVGLSRQLYGLTIASERPRHKMREYWYPIGPVGIISAFNFPVAVWAWNATLALVCGNSIIWKPSEKTPLTALACQALFEQVCAEFKDAPSHLSQLLIGGRDVGAVMVDDHRMAVISATGSTAMGRVVGERVAHRFGRRILELGGNNAVIITPSADLDLALRAVLFGAVGTCGQRCTTTRRLFLHNDIYDQFMARLEKAYTQVPIGDPQAEGTLVGPLIDEQAYSNMQNALAKAAQQGGRVVGGARFETVHDKAFYVHPAIVHMPDSIANVSEEVFAPILYVFRYSDMNDAIARQNDVPQGLSSAIFTRDIREAELFTSEYGSDCGIANVNLGTSGAEIGGAFGGEKETGGGRESGSDSWKAYMRRMTSTVNYSNDLPLAQGIQFNLD